MKHTIRLISLIATACLVSTGILSAQQRISGQVLDARETTVPGANIYLENTYDGASSDAEGTFSFPTGESGDQTLVCSFIGYEDLRVSLFLNGRDTSLVLILKESAQAMEEVVITAGHFNAGDKKKATILNAMDIASTASALGDIYGAFATMPGALVPGEEGRLFVRGGDSRETRTYMDGMWVQSPYFTKVPDIPTRGRFSPLLFSEMVFSTGGYSAEFGQALSSVVDLNTNGLEPQDKGSVSLMSVGGSVSGSKRWENSSVAGTLMGTTSVLHHRLFRPRVDFLRDPRTLDGNLMFRKRVGEEGLLKIFLSHNRSSMELMVDHVAEDTCDRLALTDRSGFGTAVLTGRINENWRYRGGVAVNLDGNDMVYRSLPIDETHRSGQAKLVVVREGNLLRQLRLGAESGLETQEQSVRTEPVVRLFARDRWSAGFLEGDLVPHPALALRLGIRLEHTSLTESFRVAPRASLALKTGEKSQVSLATGIFHQNPGFTCMKWKPDLEPEEATHVILNFQRESGNRILRLEAYAKKYTKLVTYQEPDDVEPDHYRNDGHGLARGIDVFWRDRGSIEGLDYWLSYGFLDTKRRYRDYPETATPSFASTHAFSAVAKYYFQRPALFTTLTLTYASPRPYQDPNSAGFMTGRTPAYRDISMGITHLTRLWNRRLVLHVNLNNVTAFKNVFGYEYTQEPDAEGVYASRAILPPMDRQIVFVAILSLEKL
ncbi:MAG: TonB-dependent receptor [Bacteroidales bacterium]